MKLRLCAAAALLLACGLVHHDVTVTQDFQAGGSAPNAATLDGTKLTGPLAANAGDLSKLSKVSVTAVRLEATDNGDLSFVSGGSLAIHANGLPDATIATLPAQPAAGATSADWNTTGVDLRSYLAAGAQLDAQVTYASRPVSARGLRLTLTVRGEL